MQTGTVILCIDTSLEVCSVAVAISGSDTPVYLEERGVNIHSARLTLMIGALMKKAGLTLNEIDGVCIDKGPGSYTGLRIGVSAAKGLCYALGKPLLSINTLQTMAMNAIRVMEERQNGHIPADAWLCPMIDARRMEVYYALFNRKGAFVSETKAEVVEADFLRNELEKKQIVFFGNGAEKCRSLLADHPNALFLPAEIYPGAAGMAALAMEKYENKAFENLFTFEPFYLKDFMIQRPDAAKHI